MDKKVPMIKPFTFQDYRIRFKDTMGLKPHYFSIEHILATQERVPCTFTKSVIDIGNLDPSSESSNLEKGTSLELPYWAVKALSNLHLQIIKVDLPKVYKEGYRDILKADASVVDLHKLSKYFYLFGKLLSNIDKRESQALRNMLIQAFKDRFRQVMDWAQNLGTVQPAMERLDHLEREILARGQATQLELNKWLREGGGSIGAATMVANHKKRKLTAIDLL